MHFFKFEDGLKLMVNNFEFRKLKLLNFKLSIYMLTKNRFQFESRPVWTCKVPKVGSP